MGASDIIEVTDRDGWRKDFVLERNIVHVGSDRGNDVVLEPGRGGGVASRHFQLISLTAPGTGYRLVNLANTDILLGDGGDRRLAPRSFAEITGNQRLRVGDFTLVLRLVSKPEAYEPEFVAPTPVLPKAQPVGQSAGIGLSLSLPQTRLSSQRPLDGMILVRNLGDKTGAQFMLEMEGMPSDCYEMGPGPILFPGAEKEVPLRLHHPKRPTPLAGEHSIAIRATAPEAYPGESAVVSQIVEVLPFYRHSLRLVTEVSG